jgi:hypothetical protein
LLSFFERINTVHVYCIYSCVHAGIFLAISAVYSHVYQPDNMWMSRAIGWMVDPIFFITTPRTHSNFGTAASQEITIQSSVLRVSKNKNK